MIKEIGILILIIFLLSGVCALCNETQIDINTANLTELDKLEGIGLAYSQRIIDARSFSSVDDLIRVSGIGNKTLEKIKSQGLACVEEGEKNLGQNIQEEQIEKTETEETPELELEIKATTLDVIDTNSKDIKSEDNKEILKRNLALAGIVTFCTGFGALFLLRQLRRKQKNEFR